MLFLLFNLISSSKNIKENNPQTTYHEDNKTLVITGSGTFSGYSGSGSDSLDKYVFIGDENGITIESESINGNTEIYFYGKIILKKHCIKDNIHFLYFVGCQITADDEWFPLPNIDTVYIFLDCSFSETFFNNITRITCCYFSDPFSYANYFKNTFIYEFRIITSTSITRVLPKYNVRRVLFVVQDAKTEVVFGDGILNQYKYITYLGFGSLEKGDTASYKVKCEKLADKLPNLRTVVILVIFGHWEFASDLFSDSKNIELVEIDNMNTLSTLNINAKCFDIKCDYVDGNVSRFTNLEMIRFPEGFQLKIKEGSFDGCKNLRCIETTAQFTFEGKNLPESVTTFKCSINYIGSIPANNNIECLILTDGNPMDSIAQYASMFAHVKTLILNMGFFLKEGFLGTLPAQITTVYINSACIKMEEAQKFINLKNLTLEMTDSKDINFQYVFENLKYVDKLESLVFTGSYNFDLSYVDVDFPSLKYLSVPKNAKFGSTSPTANRKLKATDRPILPQSVLSSKQISHIALSNGDSSNDNNIVISETFSGKPIKNITFLDIDTVWDTAFNGLKDVHISFETSISKISITKITQIEGVSVEMPFENGDFFFKDGVFYEETITKTIDAIPQSESVEILEGVLEIPSDLFQNNGVVKSIVLPSSITKIDSGSFTGCTSLESIACESSKVEIEGEIFDKGASVEITVPEDFEGDSFGGLPVKKENGGTPPPKGKTLTPGAIAGIVIAVIVVVAAICFGVWFFIRKNNTNNKDIAEERQEKQNTGDNSDK